MLVLYLKISLLKLFVLCLTLFLYLSREYFRYFKIFPFWKQNVIFKNMLVFLPFSIFELILYISGTYKLAINETFLGESACLSNPYSFLVVQASSFLFIPLNLTQSVRSHLVTLPFILQPLCDLWNAMPLHWSSNVFYPYPCLRKQAISLGVASILTMCLC